MRIAHGLRGLTVLLALAACDDGGGSPLNPARTDGGGAGGMGGGDFEAGPQDGAGGGGRPVDATTDMPPRPDAALPDAALPDVALPDAARPDAAVDAAVDAANPAQPFSFFVTSLEGMRRLSGSQDGFGGNLGGLEGADRICQQLAESVGQGAKTWRAFLSATTGGADGGPVHAIERIGQGPWYDANGRLVAENIAGLLSGNRPAGDPATINDLPDEHGVPITALGDAHDVVTASNTEGRLFANNLNATCNDWTSDSGAVGNRNLMCGHSFPRMGGGGRGGAHWMSDHPLRGCEPGVNLIQNGPGVGTCIGCSGGYGALYCFALSP